MLRLKTFRTLPLNCSSGGVLYHYTKSLANLKSILQNGLQVSEGQPYGDNDVPYISFSRTKTNPPYTGLADIDDDTSSRWSYAVILSRSKLSNLGKLVPYHWAAENREIDLQVYFYDPSEHTQEEFEVPDAFDFFGRLLLDKEDNTADIQITCKDKRLDDYVFTTIDIPVDKIEQIQNELSSEPMLTVRSKNDHDTLSEIPFRGSFNKETPIVHKNGWLTRIINALLEKVKEYKTRTQERSSQLSVKGQNPEPTYFPDSSPTTYEEFKKAAKELKEKFPSIDVNQNLDTNTWTIRGELPEGTHFTDLPKTIQVLVSRSGIYESEDRLLLPSATPGTTIPETKDAIIGIVVPRKEYHSKAVEKLHKEFADIPVYTYAGKNEKKRRSNAKPIPREAYRNPVA